MAMDVYLLARPIALDNLIGLHRAFIIRMRLTNCMLVRGGQHSKRSESQLTTEREATLRYKGENGIMSKKFVVLSKDIEDQKVGSLSARAWSSIYRQLFESKSDYTSTSFSSCDTSCISECSAFHRKVLLVIYAIRELWLMGRRRREICTKGRRISTEK